jgi:hypothetical protein
MQHQNTLHISGRRWFQKTYGNTYHTASIYINGQLVHKTPMEYGYGDMYLQTAVDWLKEHGHLPANAEYGTRYLRYDSGYLFTHDVADVLKRDL